MAKVMQLLSQFQERKATQIPREENAKADALANLWSTANITDSKTNSVVHLFCSTIDQNQENVNATNLICDWRNEFLDYLQNKMIPEDKKRWWTAQSSGCKILPH